MAGLFMVLGSLALAIAIRFRRLRWTRSRRTRGYTRLTGGGREHVMSVYRKALRTLERKGYPRRQSHQAPGDYLAHLEAEAVLVPILFRDLTHRADAALYDPRSQDSLLTAAVAVLIKPLRNLPRLG